MNNFILSLFIRKLRRNTFSKCDTTTAAAPNAPAPCQETTPPEVYALGMYRSNKSRGADMDNATVAKKKEIYNVKLAHIIRIMGRLGLKEGTIWVL
jgi:hypothetical protein